MESILPQGYERPRPTEVLRGMPDDLEFSRVKQHLNNFPCLTAKTPHTFIHAADLYRQCRKKGVAIRSPVDCLIAAVCIENKASLLHHDSDFDRLTKQCGLKKASPSEILG